MTFEELIQAIEDYYEHLYDEDADDYEERDYSHGLSEFGNEDNGNIPGIGKYKEVDSEGPYDGHEWESIRYFPDHDIYIRIKAFYYSFNGLDFDDTEWSDIEQVFPFQETITVYKTNQNEF